MFLLRYGNREGRGNPVKSITAVARMMNIPYMTVSIHLKRGPMDGNVEYSPAKKQSKYDTQTQE